MGKVRRRERKRGMKRERGRGRKRERERKREKERRWRSAERSQVEGARDLGQLKDGATRLLSRP